MAEERRPEEEQEIDEVDKLYTGKLKSWLATLGGDRMDAVRTKVLRALGAMAERLKSAREAEDIDKLVDVALDAMALLEAYITIQLQRKREYSRRYGGNYRGGRRGGYRV